MSRTRPTFRKTMLASATALCLAVLASPVFAQGATGAVAGRADPGTVVTISNPATGFSRNVTVAADGSYRIGQLPPGDYQLQVSRGGAPVGEALAVNVPLGGTANINLGSDGSVTNIGAVTVVGSGVVNRVDVQSVETATNITREELARVPVDQSLGSVALLAPGVIGGNSSFGGISFGGSSVAENSVFINGLNVTDFFRRQSWSAAPFAFYREFQVKTGGYSVEFGRSTGGVINAVTRSGDNELRGGIEVTFEPNAWRSKGDDHEFADTYYRFDANGQLVEDPALSGVARYVYSRDKQALTKTNLWASGPLIKDRLFLFAMYENRASNFTGVSPTSYGFRRASNGFWGAKLDWNISDNHLLELMAFSDEADSGTDNYSYDWNSAQVGTYNSSIVNSSGGKSGSLTYTGHFGDNFTAKAMYGINRSTSMQGSPVDGVCDWVSYNSSYQTILDGMPIKQLGCHPRATVLNHEDERKVGRLDFEWSLGSHLLRFGLDREVMTTDRTTRYPGSGIQYIAYTTNPGAPLDNGAVVPPGVTEILFGRRRIDGGMFETTANAWYIEDNWNVTPNLLLNLGVRVDAFNNKTALGASFIKMDKLVSPRLGFSWDMTGDGSKKLFGNLGRYYLPVTNNINYTFSGGLIDERTFYPLNGWTQQTNPATGAPYMAPIIGPQIGPVDTQYNVVVTDLRQSVDRDLDAVYQDELILGFQQALSQAWSWGVNATYRKMTNALDDVRINHTPCGPVGYNLWPIANPGKPLTIWGDASIGCAQEGWITIDTSKDGYRKGGSGEVIGYFEPKREYKAVEFQIDRAWDRKWAFNASYLWSRSTGNHEGPVNSDTGYADTGMVQHWDHPANNDRYGVLFNDHTHQIKLRGTYAFNDNWTVGGTLTAQSGGPITAFGVAWPGDTIAGASFVTEGSGGGTGWLCVQNCHLPYDQRVYEFTPRGGFGRMPWTYNLGANVTWKLPIDVTDIKLRLSVFNLLNAQEVINVRARYERGPGVPRTTFNTGTRWQSPRYAQLVLSWEF